MNVRLLSLFITLLVGHQVHGQLTGGRENSQKSPSVSEVGKLSGGIYSGDVNTFTGGHQSSIPLGSVSTLSGLGYTLELNRGSSFSFGGNEPKVKGLLYGDGWELNIPVITVTTDIFHRFGNGAECQDNGGIDTLNTNLKTSDYDRSWEGDVFWLEPYVSIPGVGSGRAVFKYVDAVDANCAVFVLNKFSTSVELRFYGTSWVVKVGDGSVYVFEGTIRQFSAPSNKRQFHYDNTTYTYSPSDEGTAVVLENNYPVKEDAVNVIEPKIYYNSWYCSRIFHPNYQGQNIIFEYERYGAVNFFKEFQQENYKDVHRAVFADREYSYLPDYTTYRHIVLQRVIGSSVDGNTDIIELEYGIDGSLSSSYLLTPGVSGAVATDPMYCSQVVKRYDGTSSNSYSGWHRYPHANRDKDINPEDINETNPYINPLLNYVRESVTAVASGIPFDHGFLESPRISDAAALVAGDLYEIRTRVTRPDGEDLKNGNGTLDIAVVTNGTAGTSYSEPSSPILHTNYGVTRGEQLFSTFNMAMKWQMGWGDEVLQTSNLFVMPNLPENFQGFNIQVGPGNSDIDYNYAASPSTLLYTTVTPPIQNINRPNALWAYPQVSGQTSLKSSGTIARNFGTGHPWGSMVPVYNHRALVGASGTGSPASFEELYKGTWSMTLGDITTHGDFHNPTKFNNTVELEEVELIRHGRTGYMLMGVKQYRMEGEYGGPVTTGKKLVSQKRIKYEINHVNVRQNRNYAEGNTVVMGNNNGDVILLKSVHEVPLEGNLYATNFGLTDPTVVLTTDFEYANLLPASGTYSQTTPYVGLVYYALTKYTDNLGGITKIEYYPIHAAPTRTYSTMNFNWHCGMYSPASYGVEKSFTMNLAVKSINKRAADYDELTQAFVPSSRQWEYVYDLTKSTFSFKRLALPSEHFRTHYLNDYEMGYAKVTVYEPALETGERNYTVHEFYGDVDYSYTLPITTTITDYLYYGKPKSIKTYDHLGKIHQEKLFNYAYTLAFEDGYERPNFYRDQVNRYYQPVTDNYEYRDYYTGDEPTALVGSTVQTGDAAKWTIAGSVRGIGGSEGYSMEHPKYLPFYFHDELRTAVTLSDVDGNPLASGYLNPAYAFNSYFVKLVSEIDRTYEDGLTTQLASNPVVVTDPVRNKEPKPRNPFGTGVIKPATAFDSLYLDIIANSPAEAYKALMQAGNSLSEEVLGAVGQSDSFNFDQKVDIMANQGGLTDGIWLGILNAATYLTPLQLQRLVLSQPYFTDTIQKKAIEVRLTDKSILTAILTRNAYLSDDVVGYITNTPSTWMGISYEQSLEAQPHQFTDSLLTAIVEDEKLKWRMLPTVLKHQQPLDDHYRILIDRTELTTASIADLFLTGDGTPSDTILYYFFTERTTDSTTAQAIIDHVARPLPNYLKGHLQITFPLIVFHNWETMPGYNPLSAYCGNPVSGSRIYIETKTEYEYYEADYRGHAQGKAYELLMGMISSIDEPSTFPKNVPTYSMDDVYIPALKLKYEPSWQVFAKKVTSPHLPGAYQREEYFYLYDLQNRYGRHWANYDVTNYDKYQVEEFWDTGIPLDTIVYNNDLNAVYHPYGQLPEIPQYDGMVKSREYNMRGIPFQKTSFSRTAADPAVVSRSEYYHYDARWNFTDLPGASIERTFTGDTCIIPPGEPSCPCVYENHIFGDYEMGLLEQRYPLEDYCYYHLGGDGTGWQYAYWVCPQSVDPYLCYDGITSAICAEPEGPESPENPGGPIAIFPIGEVLSKTLQLRSTYVQVDTVDYLSDHDFLDNKWDRKNRYIAEFGMDGIGPDPIDGFQGVNYRMILPFTSLLSEKVLERNRHTQVALLEDATGLKTKYHYQKPTFYHYRNTRCESDAYSTVVYRNTGLPFRVTVGYGRADSMGTDYTYTEAAQVATTTNPFGLEMRYTFDGFNRLIRVQEFSSMDTLVLSEAAYHLWDRGSASDDFMERAAQNYVEKRVFNSSDPADYSFTRAYADPLGRAAGAVTVYNEQGDTRFIHTGSVWYDKWDRGIRQFKNVPASASIPSGQTHAIPALQWNYTTSFTETELERTPKNRAKKAADFGVSITSPLDKTVRKSYAIASNVYTSCELELSGDELRAIMTNGNTAAFRFFRVQTLDQDNNKSVVYTNAFGQTIGTISYLTASDKVITLFVYDNMGNVKKVINPVKLENTYEYNLLGQLYRETTPEAGEKKYMYNKRGQVSLALDQELWNRMDGTQRAPLYREYRYDAYGRPSEVGLIEGPVYRESTLYGPMHYKTEFYGFLEDGIKYPLCDVPHYSSTPPQECAYFDYVFSHSSTQDWLLRYQVTELEGVFNPGTYPADYLWDVVFSTPAYHTLVQSEKKYVYQNNTGLLARTESYDLSGYEIQRVLYGYNARGQINHQKTYFNETPQTITDITLVESAVIEYPAYSTQGLPLHQSVDVDNDGNLELQYFYQYDALGRLRAIKVLDNNGIADNATTIARYTYNDVEGVLAERMHELDKSLTKTNYSYDVRTRINRISSSNLTLDNPTVLVSHFYSYDGNAPTYQGQYIPSCGFSYNGNINAVMSSYNFSGVYGSAPSEFNYAAVYGYKYDRLNRLTDADGMVGDFVVHAMGLGLGQGPVNDALAIGDERYSYDKIGNIKQLSRTVRHSDPMNTAVVSKVEGWNYYYNGFNKLTQVNGFPGTTTRTYTYDKNGNLLTDSYREIAATEYGRTAYPYYIEADNSEIYYLYSIEDQRMYKKVVTPTETTTEFYLLDVTGKTVALRHKVGSAAAIWEYYVNGAEREARIKNVTHNGMIAAQEIEFYLYDHLGNTRVVYEPTYAGGALELAINYAADYFPYGKVLREYVNTNSGDPEKFLTTQHERDKETGLDYRGARFYDSDIARFLSIDPWQAKYPSWSTYNYVIGNPISLIDPTGKGPDDFVKREDGSIYWDDNATSSSTTKKGETYLGTSLKFTFNSFIDPDLWDGPIGDDPTGDKLTSTITLNATKNDKGQLVGISALKSIQLGDTPIGQPRDYYPGKGGAHNVLKTESTCNEDGTLNTYKVKFEQHASVSPSEEVGMNMMGLKIVDVAQRLNVYLNTEKNLSIASYTNIFPSATLSVNGSQIMYYAQPSFIQTHKASYVSVPVSNGRSYDFSYYPSAFYRR